MASPKGDLPKRGFVQQNLTSTLQPNKPNRGVLLMDIFIIACIFLKSNRKRQKIIFFLLLSQIREGEKKGQPLLHISERNKESRNKKRQITVAGHRCPVFSFIFFFAVFLFHLFLSHFFFISPSCVGTGAHLSFFFFPPVPTTCHFCPLFYPHHFLKKKEKERPSSMSFLSRFFSASFQGQKKDSQHSASSA